MLNAKLKPGVNLLHVIAMTGPSVSSFLQGEQPAITAGPWKRIPTSLASLRNGKLGEMDAYRPPSPDEGDPAPTL